MALVRRDGVENTALWSHFGRNIFDLLIRLFEMWRQLIDDDSVKVEEDMDGDDLIVRADLPGVDPEHDVDVSIVDKALSIRAERRQERRVEERNMRRSEMRYGSFSRTIALPPWAKESDIKATYKDGVLEVRTRVEERGTTTSKVPIERS